MEFVQIGFVVALLAIGLLVGRTVEMMHFRHLDRREAELGGIMLTDLRRLPENWNASHPALVAGVAVIATDYFKVFAAGIRNLFGGRVRSYETLVERARREAIVRMKTEAASHGANVVWNVRVETSDIGGGRGAGGVEVIAYGTALRVQ